MEGNNGVRPLIRRNAWRGEGGRMAARATYYRLRGDAWQTRAIALGIRPSVRAVAEAAGIPKSTFYRVVHGQPANTATVAALLDTLGLPFELLFERVEGDPEGVAL